MLVRGLLVLVLAWALGCGASFAQDWQIEDNDGSISLRVNRNGVWPSIDQLEERLLVMSLAPRVVRTSIIEGDEFLTWAVSHERVGFLQNDLMRSGSLGPRSVTLRAGTPVFRTTYHYSAGTHREPDIIERAWPMWCGVTSEPDGGPVGYCIISRGGHHEVARINDEMPFFPISLGGFAPSTAPIVVEDQAANSQLTRIEAFWILDRLERGFVQIRTGLRAVGYSQLDGRVRISRDRSGGFEHDFQGARVRFSPSGTNALAARLVTPDLSEYRAYAERLLTDARAASARQEQ